jgi:uncharacterized protein YuzE
MTEASYATLWPGDIARTVEVTEDLMVDVDADGCPLGIEVLGGTGWTQALVTLALQGRLRVQGRADGQA